MYGHADLLATLGRCTDQPCTQPVTAVDDQGRRRCAAHALAHLRAEVAERG